MIGVKLGACAKTISDDDADFSVSVGDEVGVANIIGVNCVCISITVGDGDGETAGEGDVGTFVGDGVGVKATVGRAVGAFVGVRHA